MAHPGATGGHTVHRSVRSATGWGLLAALGSWLSALVIAGVAVAVMIIGHALFSAGVGVMLLVYAGILGLIGWAAARGVGWADGLLIASSLVHIAVVVTLVRSGAPAWFLVFLVLGAVVLLAAVMLAVGHRGPTA